MTICRHVECAKARSSQCLNRLDTPCIAGKRMVATFSTNLDTLSDSAAYPNTAQWWASQPEAWAACRKDPEAPAHAMARYVAWIQHLEGKPVCVVYPAGFDFLFVYWYLMRFVGESPFSHSALDMKSFARAVLKTDFRDSTKEIGLNTGSMRCRTRTSHSTMRSSRAHYFATCAKTTVGTATERQHQRALNTIRRTQFAQRAAQWRRSVT